MLNISKNQAALSALFIGAAIALGAVGAHRLRGVLSPKDFDIYQTAVFYHLFNSFGSLVILSLSPQFISDKKATLISRLLLFGVLIFSGSLYTLVTTNTRWLGAITPIGGLLLIASWIWLSIEIFDQNKDE